MLMFLNILFFFVAVIDCGHPNSLLNGGFQFLSGSNNEYRSVVQYYCNEPFYSLAEAKTGESVSGSALNSSFISILKSDTMIIRVLKIITIIIIIIKF